MAQTISDLFVRLDKDYRLRQRKSLTKARYHWAAPQRFMGFRHANEITEDDIRDFVIWRQSQKASNATINRELSGLKRAMKLGKLQWPGFEFLPETGVRQGTYTRQEVEQLAMALPEHVRPVLWFGYYTGRRKSEILAIQWKDIEWEKEWIVIQSSTTKTAQPDRIPLSGPLLSLCMVLKEQRKPGSSFLFTYRGQKLRNFSRAWKTSLRITGLKDKLFHDLRRTAVTDMEDAGIPRGTAMAITGHKTFSVYQRYNIVRQDSIKEGLQALQTYRENR